MKTNSNRNETSQAGKSSAITYDLRAGAANSNEFYDVLSKFSANVQQKGEMQFSDTICDYKTYLRNMEIRDKRGDAEYLLEILSIGCFWLSFGLKADNANSKALSLFQFLNRFLENDSVTGKMAKNIRRNFIYNEVLFPKMENGVLPELSYIKFVKLIDWLKATNEYNAEVQRFEQWKKYFDSMPLAKADSILGSFVFFSAWFEYASKNELGKYTQNVNDFLENTAKKENKRDDCVVCAKPELEYFLNIIGAELINKTLQEYFEHSTTLSVWAPTCMRGVSQENCKSLKTNSGQFCSACNKECNIGKIAAHGKDLDFAVRIIEHSSDLENEIAKEENRAIIGIACVGSVINGGLILRKYEMPAQCVYLDFCGACRHWSESGNPSDINIDKLLELIKSNKKSEINLLLNKTKRA